MVKLCFFLLLLSAALAVNGCGGAKIPLQASVMSEGNVACESHAFSGVVLLSQDNASYLKKHFSTLWDPSANAVNEATSKIEDYLRQVRPDNPWQVEDLSEIRARLSKTVCQAVGITFEGHKAILLNCLPAKNSFTQSWRDRFIEVFDGGAHYWNVIYIPESGSFVNLQINGVA